MTRQGWAERLANAACNKFLNTYPVKPWTHYAEQALRAEHKRAVRVVKKEIKWQAARIAEEQQAHNADGEAIHNYALLVVHDILAALQKGRT